MKIKNFVDLKRIIDKTLSIGNDKERHPNFPDDFFDANGKFVWPNFAGEIWKEGSDLFITFEIDTPHKDVITIKISDIDWLMPTDYQEETSKRLIYEWSVQENFPVVQNYNDFKENVL